MKFYRNDYRSIKYRLKYEAQSKEIMAKIDLNMTIAYHDTEKKQ